MDPPTYVVVQKLSYVKIKQFMYQPYASVQSTRFCSDNGMSCPVFLKYCPSSAPVEENAQHDPQRPCKHILSNGGLIR